MTPLTEEVNRENNEDQEAIRDREIIKSEPRGRDRGAYGEREYNYQGRGQSYQNREQLYQERYREAQKYNQCTKQNFSKTKNPLNWNRAHQCDNRNRREGWDDNPNNDLTKRTQMQKVPPENHSNRDSSRTEYEVPQHQVATPQLKQPIQQAQRIQQIQVQPKQQILAQAPKQKGRKDAPPSQDDIEEQKILREGLVALQKEKEQYTVYYGLLRIEQIFKKIQNQAVLIRSSIKIAVNDIGKLKANESLIENIKQVFYLVKSLQLQITTIHFPGKLNSTTDSLSRLCRSGDHILKDGMVQMICKTWNYMPQIDIFAIQENSGDMIEIEKQGSKASSIQCGRLPSGPVADVGRDLLMRCMKLRGFSEERVNLLFKSQLFNTVKRDFFSLTLLQDWLDIERITIEETMKREAEVILTEVFAFYTRQNNSAASVNSYKACLSTMSSPIYKRNFASSTTSKLINKALADASIPHRRYQLIRNILLRVQLQWSKVKLYLHRPIPVLSR
ncbi:MAG: hypothetical protein EZS28_030269, partial [Streblomastix strix]